MGAFYRANAHRAAIVLMAIATIFVVRLKVFIPKPPVSTHRQDAILNGVDYEDIRGPSGTRCRLLVKIGNGGEFQAFHMGLEHMRSHYNTEEFWFWLSSHDPNRLFFCPISDIDKAGLSPMFRPSFAVCVSGLSFVDKDHPEDGTIEFEEGEYRVVATFKGGLLSRQTYLLDGSPALTVVFNERQLAGGRMMPKTISLNLHDGRSATSLDMGTPNMNPEVTRWISPPSRKERTRLGNVH